MKKYALIEFTDRGISVVLSSAVEEFDEAEWQENRQKIWSIRWSKKCSDGVVVTLSDDKRKLSDRRDRMIAGDDSGTPVGLTDNSSRTPKRQLEMATPPCPVPKVSRPNPRPVGLQDILERARGENEMEDEQNNIRQETHELKGQVQRMESAMTRMEEMLATAIANSPTRNDPQPQPQPQPQAANNADASELFTDIFTRTLVNKCCKTNAAKLTNDLCQGAYSLSYMATHTVAETSTAKGVIKEAIPKEHLMTIIDIVQRYFPNAEATIIKNYMRIKFGNAVKWHKRNNANQKENERQDRDAI